MIYDVHAHCIPAEFKSWLGRRGGSVGADLVETDRGIAVCFDGRVTTRELREDLSDVEARIAEMDRMGVDVQVLSGWIDLTGYELDARTAIDYANAHNDALATEASRSPDRFRSLGTVPLQDPGSAVTVLDRAMTELGMKGVEIATTIDGVYPHRWDGLDDFWAAAVELGAFVLLHPMRPLSGVDLDAFFLENMVGRPAESTLSLAGLILSGVFERFPGLKLCVVHGGGFAPFQIGRIDRGFHEKPGLVGRHISRPPSDYLKGVYVDTVVHGSDALRYLIEYMGPDRVMLGTDYPFEMGDRDPVDFIRSVVGADDALFAAITGRNAAACLEEAVE